MKKKTAAMLLGLSVLLGINQSAFALNEGAAYEAEADQAGEDQAYSDFYSGEVSSESAEEYIPGVIPSGGDLDERSADGAEESEIESTSENNDSDEQWYETEKTDGEDELQTAAAEGITVDKISGAEYQISLKSQKKINSGIRFAVWSDTGWQDDLQWYTASESHEGTEYSYVCAIDIRRHKHTGKYYIDAYSDNTYIASGIMQAEGVQKASVVQEWIDEDKGSWRIVVSGMENEELIQEVRIPTWCRADQSDIKWYTAKKQNDGTYAADINAGNHAFHTGTYTHHVYVTDVFGVRSYVGQTKTNFDKEISTELDVTADSKETVFTVTLYNYLSDASSVRAAVWTEAGWQDDLQWVTLNKDSKGAYKGSFRTASLKHSGKVYVDAYDGGKYIKTAVASISKPADPVIEISNLTTKGFDVRLSGVKAASGVREIRIAVWTVKDGQDDLKWYPAAKQPDGSYVISVHKGDHKKNTGEYLVDTYLTDGNGLQSYTGGTKVTVPEPEQKVSVEVKKNKGGYRFLTKNIDIDDITSVTYAVWSRANGQDDLKWYTGTYDAASNTASFDFRPEAHRDFGLYYVHCYAYTAGGSKTGLGGTTFEVNASAEITNSVSGTWFRVNMKPAEVPFEIRSVRIAVWSSADQSNIVWYDAVKNSDGVYYIASHTGRHNSRFGMYTAHIYVYGTNGMSGCIGTTSFKVGAGHNSVSLQTDNGSMKVSASFLSNQNIRAVWFPVWTQANGQDDLAWYQGEQQPDGSWAVWVNIGRHNYETGLYLADCYVDYTDGSRQYTGGTTFTVREDVGFYTVVNSENQATCIVQGYTSSSKVTIDVWSNNAGQDDLRTYTASRNGNGWRAVIPKANHGSAGYYMARLYVDGNYVCSDSFSFDNYRYSTSWSAISTAHAAGGGGADRSQVYTNCIQQMEASYANGFRSFEIDVNMTSDGVPVLYHTWNTGILDNYTYSAARSSGPKYSDFMKDTMYGGAYATSDFGDLLTYLSQHRDVKVLLDPKYTSETSIRTLYKLLTKKASDMGMVSVMREQIVPYFFNEQMYDWIYSTFHFNEMHYATYTYGWKYFTEDQFRGFCKFCRSKKVTSISMWDVLATKEVIKIADSYGITVYVHTTDDTQTASDKLKMGAAGIITNRILPDEAMALIGM